MVRWALTLIIMNDYYAFSVPVFKKSLGGLRLVLEKAQAYVEKKGMPEAEFLADALYPDMFPFVKQVQSASDNAKGACARLAGVEVPKYEDTEASIAELIARIDTTCAFLDTLAAEQFADAGTRKITLPYFPGKYMTGEEYFKTYALPNFFFHYCMAYAIARKNGVEIGKAEYINGYQLHELA